MINKEEMRKRLNVFGDALQQEIERLNGRVKPRIDEETSRQIKGLLEENAAMVTALKMITEVYYADADKRAARMEEIAENALSQLQNTDGGGRSGNAWEELSMSRTLCTNCKRIYTNNGLCVRCQNVDQEKVYPSKIAVVYPEGSLMQNVAIFAFNHLADSIDKQPELASELAKEFKVSESEIHMSVETLHTEN